jgi:arsenate reductase (glutaredoxin)
MIIYGIPNCDTIKKTLDWFKANKIPFEFYNYKLQSPSTILLKNWVKQVGYEAIINKKSTTWKALTLEQQQAITNTKAAMALIAQNPSIIKRPIIVSQGSIIAIGFRPLELELIIATLNKQ